MPHKTIAFIGAGNMAFAIISGLIRSGYPAQKIIANNKNNLQRRADFAKLGVMVGLSNRQAVEQADVVVLAVKPQMIAEVCSDFSQLDFSQKWVISIAAGISIARLESLLPTAKIIIRTMPNTPALIGEGMTGIFAKKGLDQTACQFVEQLFSAVGRYYWLDEEAKINQIIALTGSSPAYFFYFMEAMQQAAIKIGISEADARLLVQSVALGTAKMVAVNKEHSFTTLRENVTSKGGTTAKAIAVFEQYKLTEMVEQAMQAAILRAEEMEVSL
ncbi:pyrroline-5-carboxylate reductase [Nicoletella semolina]|uniref:Pyrroline-5-carboxylate reductase n=1 Tax=Nicoletella semolina TaxID=271160 RepID=A0A4R2N8D7_9PAST|nr:pyrroline-5-carboxylate reductase [Nicoletella semolina]MDH2923896.1 pyrroline-5-carboxylate reductase [Nicoletella semolina]TCP17211.1 pyrroline-5-carboxylate reductase [Nicoletella semolina]